MSVVLATQAGLEARAIPHNTVSTVQYQGGLEVRAIPRNTVNTVQYQSGLEVRAIPSGCNTKFCDRDFVLKSVVMGKKRTLR